jgi:hypothetical protein
VSAVSSLIADFAQDQGKFGENPALTRNRNEFQNWNSKSECLTRVIDSK